MAAEIPPVLIDVERVCEMLSIRRSKALELAYRGELPSIKIGTRRLFGAQAVRAWAEQRLAEAANASKGEADHVAQ